MRSRFHSRVLRVCSVAGGVGAGSGGSSGAREGQGQDREGQMQGSAGRRCGAHLYLDPGLAHVPALADVEGGDGAALGRRRALPLCTAEGARGKHPAAEGGELDQHWPWRWHRWQQAGRLGAAAVSAAAACAHTTNTDLRRPPPGEAVSQSAAACAARGAASPAAAAAAAAGDCRASSRCPLL